VTRVLAERRGVCQDFAHLQIGCLRSLGLAARYVSGYLVTEPPPGQPRLVGADASHAWLSVWCPRSGWLDLDPTNDVLPSRRHVTLAWGRDYGDVSPLRGVVLGGVDHTLHVGVSVAAADVPAISVDGRALSPDAHAPEQQATETPKPES
jgi:transglutaminase-like putative cysteine protease